MKMAKHSDEDKARFRTLVGEAPGVLVKPMFGSIGAFINGNMYAGLFKKSIGVKPSADDMSALEALPGSHPFGPDERPMGGWISLPLDMPAEEMTGWIERARSHVSTLPPKVKKK